MTIVTYTLLTALYIITPAIVLWLCRRFSILGKIGPILTLYAIGIAMRNIGTIPDAAAPLQGVITTAMIPLAIPMMLFGCRFSRQEVGLQIKLLASGFISVAIAVGCGYLLYGNQLPEGNKLGGIVAGMYTGGTVNAAALQGIFHIDEDTYCMINTCDILISSLYFIFLFTVGIKLFRWLYREATSRHSLSLEEQQTLEVSNQHENRNPYTGLWSRKGIKEIVKIFAITIIIAIISAGVSIVATGGIRDDVFILTMTSLSVLCSLSSRIRSLTHSYDIGMYCIYIFSLAIASMADLSEVNINNSLNLLLFLFVAVFLSLIIHAILCRVLRVDADSMTISSVAFINSPPFVPMVAIAMRNKNALVTGLAAGIAGYALGNYFGVAMANILERL